MLQPRHPAGRKTSAVTRLLLSRGFQGALFLAVLLAGSMYAWFAFTVDVGPIGAQEESHREFIRKLVRTDRPPPALLYAPTLASTQAVAEPLEPEPSHPMREHPHRDLKYRLHKLPENDTSPRCRLVGICDGDHSCGPDGLGCVVSSKERQRHIREAARWTWKGYRCVRGAHGGAAGVCMGHMEGPQVCAWGTWRGYWCLHGGHGGATGVCMQAPQPCACRHLLQNMAV